MQQGTDGQDFAPGQVWRFETGPGYEQATLTILKTETLPEFGRVVHIYVEGVALPRPDGGVETRIIHMPFSEAAIDSSVTELVREGAPLPGYEESYQSWRQGDESGGFGVFTVPVRVIIDGAMGASNGRA